MKFLKSVRQQVWKKLTRMVTSINQSKETTPKTASCCAGQTKQFEFLRSTGLRITLSCQFAVFPTKIQKEHCRNFGNLELFALKQKITLLPCKSPFSWYPQSKRHVFVKMEDTIISFCLHMKNYLKSLATIITHQLFQRENHESPGNHQVIPPRLARFLHSPWMPLRLSSAVERLWTWSTWSRSPGQGRLNGLLAGVKHQK